MDGFPHQDGLRRSGIRGRKSDPVHLLRNVIRNLAPDPFGEEVGELLVYRVPELNTASGGTSDTWERRIFELSDGRSIGEIGEILYREEIMAGASMADIGLWKGLFYRNLANTVGELASRGYLRLSSREAPRPEEELHGGEHQ